MSSNDWNFLAFTWSVIKRKYKPLSLIQHFQCIHPISNILDDKQFAHWNKSIYPYMTISELFVYPIKSTARIPVMEHEVNITGFKGDRMFVVMNQEKQVLTGREYPRLLGVNALLDNNAIRLTAPEKEELIVHFSEKDRRVEGIGLFKNVVSGYALGEEASGWMSELLGIKCELVAMKELHRPMLLRHGAKDGDVVSYADASPVHLLSEASVEDLNTRLAKPVNIHHFRPNMVVKDCLPYAEDQWKRVVIGECEFEVHLHCKRCVFSTIDPESQEKDINGEPLRTLSQYRKQENGAVVFGVYLIPRKMGKVSVGDMVVVK